MPQYSHQNDRITLLLFIYAFLYLCMYVCMGMSLSMSQRSALNVIPPESSAFFFKKVWSLPSLQLAKHADQ